MFDYILFDLDGTLTDPKIGITKSVQYALRALGVEEPDLDKLECFIGPPLRDSFMEFYGFDEAQTRRAVAKYRERFEVTGIFENKIFPGIAQLLKTLKEHGKKVAIASSKPTELVERILVHFSISRYFDDVVGSEQDGTRSRKEEVVEEALRRMVPEADVGKRVAMVGDRRFDIEGARAFGLTGIGVSFGYAAEGELEAAGADYIVDSVAALEALLCAEA
ncbi:MAG: HAD-IA family hydrolase [Roseburia sp.]|nr:HAD-IA family hydrolase [Roseburia sp.]